MAKLKKDCTAKEWAALSKSKRERLQRWREGNRQQLNAQRRVEYQRDKERIKALRRKQRTGCDATLFTVLLEIQNGRCGVCRAQINSSAHADHCHKTNTMWGILCSRCNKAIGLLGDCYDGVRRALDYLRRPPADIAKLI